MMAPLARQTQGPGDLGLGALALLVAVLGQLERTSFAAQDRLDDGNPGDAASGDEDPLSLPHARAEFRQMGLVLVGSNQGHKRLLENWSTHLVYQNCWQRGNARPHQAEQAKNCYSGGAIRVFSLLDPRRGSR